jgi:hypothetical protein
MDSKTICYCVVALLLGMLLANMLKNVCGCNVVEGLEGQCVLKAGIDPRRQTATNKCALATTANDCTGVMDSRANSICEFVEDDNQS